MKQAFRSQLILGLGLVGAMACLVHPATANSAVEVKNNYFDIGGVTVEEISDALENHAAMQDNRGQSAKVKSDWDTEWTFWWRESPHGCYASAVEAKVIFTNTLPNWLNEATASPELRARWRRTSAAYDLYLQQSMLSGKNSVVEIGSLYRRVGIFKTCEELERAFHKRANHISNLYRIRALAVAKRLEHGSRQMPDLAAPIGAQVPVAGGPDMDIDGWCQISSDLETVRQGPCQLKRRCETETARCSIDYLWGDDHIRVDYQDGEPRAWNDNPAGYAFINAEPCVQNTVEGAIFCFSEDQPIGTWFYHLP